MKDDEKDSKQFKASKKNESEKPRKAIPSNELFGKKPITRVEETTVNRKLQKLESEFHDDEDFDAVLKQLDRFQDAKVVHSKEKDNSVKNTDTLNKSEAAVKTGMSISLSQIDIIT